MNEEAMSHKGDCWICFNNENPTYVTTGKVLKQIVTYLDTSIVIKSFENDPPVAVSCCSYCYESAHQLILIAEQVEQLQTKISDLSLLFSQDVLERRRQFKNEENESTNKLDPSNHKCSTIQKNPDCLPVIIGKIEVKKEIIDCVLNELPSDFQKQTGRDDFNKEAWFPDYEFENVTKNNCEIDIHSEEDLDVKYSYDEIVCPADEVIAPNPAISATHSNNKVITTSVDDLLKCLKMPIIKLHRLQSLGRRYSSKISAVDKLCDVKSTINDSSSNISDNYRTNENVCLPDSHLTITFSNRKDGIVHTTKAVRKSAVVKDEVPKNKKHSNENKPYKCSICRWTFKKIYDLQNHKKLHNNGPPYPCSFCHKSYPTPSALTIHIFYHTGERPYTCSICSKGFVSSNKLKSHEKIHSGEKPYACSICEKSFVSSFNMMAHEKIHSGKKPYKCAICKKCFRLPKTLKIHQKTHNGIKPYKCRICETAFKRVSHLNEHEKSHSGKKLYKCSSCKKSFAKARTLEKHKMIHYRERQYQCSFCEKSCLKLSILKIHERIHTGEKPFSCSFCSKSFTSSGNAKTHENTKHSGERPYKCSICEKTFKQKQQLLNHRERKHGEVYCG